MYFNKFLLINALLLLLIYFEIDNICINHTTYLDINRHFKYLDINNKNTHLLFNFLNHILLIINICVIAYFIVFQNLFHYSLYVIFILVTNYFTVFNELFKYTLDSLVILVYGYYDILELIIDNFFKWPNILICSLLINCLLFWLYIILKINK